MNGSLRDLMGRAEGGGCYCFVSGGGTSRRMCRRFRGPPKAGAGWSCGHRHLGVDTLTRSFCDPPMARGPTLARGRRSRWLAELFTSPYKGLPHHFALSLGHVFATSRNAPSNHLTITTCAARAPLGPRDYHCVSRIETQKKGFCPRKKGFCS